MSRGPRELKAKPLSSWGKRSAEVVRRSKETQLTAKVLLEGRGRVKVATGLPFLDHMVEQVARYGGFDLTFRGSGDVQVDTHHLVEDAGIVLGQALSQAMGDRAGITRFASAYAPLDESLARVVVDLGKRPYLSYNVVGESARSSRRCWRNSGRRFRFISGRPSMSTLSVVAIGTTSRRRPSRPSVWRCAAP